jgi:cobalt-zinc-cadmium efflux system outer membrane protein
MTRGARIIGRVAAVAVTLAAGARAAHAAPQADAGQRLTLDAAIARALEANRTIAAARLSRPVGLADLAVARERLNPELSYEASKELPHQAIGGTIPIELGGKRQRRIDLATASLATKDAEIERVIADIRFQVRQAYFALLAAEARVSVADDLRAIAVRARDAAQARVAAGDVPRLEGVQTALALADVENELTGARGQVAAARGELNVLLGQPASTPLVLDDRPGLTSLPSLEDAVSRATASNVILKLLDRRIAEQEARRSLARALQQPDVSAGSSFVFDAQPEFTYGWRIAVGMTLPVFTQHKAGVQLEDAALAELRAEREAAAAEITGAVAAALARASALRDQITRFDADILPAAAEVERMAQDGYSAGQTGLVALLQALQSTRDIRRRGVQAGLDFQLALADLERAIGAPFIR